METIFKANETQVDVDAKKAKESLSQAETKLASLEEKYVMNEIEKDSYSFMKPKFREEVRKFQRKLDELQGTETNHNKYLNFGVSLIQNLSFCYENANLINKQKLICSIFPENLIIENGECRTARENEVILALKGFEKDFKKKNPTGESGFPVEYLRPESNRHALRHTILSRARLPVPPLRQTGQFRLCACRNGLQRCVNPAFRQSYNSINFSKEKATVRAANSVFTRPQTLANNGDCRYFSRSSGLFQ